VDLSLQNRGEAVQSRGPAAARKTNAKMTLPPGSQPAPTRTRRAAALLGTAVFLVLAPGFFVVLVPYWISRWRIQPRLLGFMPFRVFGVLLMAAGLPVLLESFARFALQGLGTPAPVFPTQHLIVKGFYRYVRNPMYVAVVSMVLGQGLLFGNADVLVYGICAWLVTHVFVLTYEEPTLRRTFGAEYDMYRANVPRWIPRLTPWSGRSK
ncbi:MAG: isoprenylcysteine carboxylmethyltransferase family protein, partial [Candidatus Acidiferrales bacterium]